MIMEGCLDGVDEIYGHHVFNYGPEGQVMVKEGAIMSGVGKVKIYVEGIGGHGSEPAACKDPITAGNAVF